MEKKIITLCNIDAFEITDGNHIKPINGLDETIVKLSNKLNDITLSIISGDCAYDYHEIVNLEKWLGMLRLVKIYETDIDNIKTITNGILTDDITNSIEKAISIISVNFPRLIKSTYKFIRLVHDEIIIGDITNDDINAFTTAFIKALYCWEYNVSYSSSSDE